MLKKRYLLIIALIISSLFGAYTFLERVNDKKNADEIFLYQLEEVQGSFALDYSNMNENDRTYNYMKASSNLSSLLNIVSFTSYYNTKNSNELIDSLDKLYFCISDTKTINNKWEIISENSKLICEYLHNICTNLNDKDSCESLINIIKEIYSSEAYTKENKE